MVTIILSHGLLTYGLRPKIWSPGVFSRFAARTLKTKNVLRNKLQLVSKLVERTDLCIFIYILFSKL